MSEVPYMEEWRPINNWESYFISNYGNVKRQSREFKDKMIDLKGSTLNNGYRYVQEINDGKRKNHLIHRLVAKAFIDNSENKPHVDHIDNNPLNNNVSNLRWCNHNENMKNIKQRTEGKKNGVVFDKTKQRWVANARLNNKSKFLGYFDTYDEARQAREAFENNQDTNEFYNKGNDEEFSELKSRPKSKRGQGEGSIHQRKNGNWRTTFQIKGIKIFDKTFKTYEEAETYKNLKISEWKQRTDA